MLAWTNTTSTYDPIIYKYKIFYRLTMKSFYAFNSCFGLGNLKIFIFLC